MIKQRFNVLRDGEAVAYNVGLTKAKELIKQGKEDFASSVWAREAIGPANHVLNPPPELAIPQAERDAYWIAHPPKPMPPFNAPRNESDVDREARERLLAEQAAQKKTKTTARISKMKARAEEGKPGPGMKWDVNTSRFVPAHAQTKVEDVAMAKKAPKAKKAKKAPRKAGEVRKGSKMEIIKNMLTRKSGCTAADLAEATGWKSVSVSLQAKTLGLKLTTEKNKDGVTRYFGA